MGKKHTIRMKKKSKKSKKFSRRKSHSRKHIRKSSRKYSRKTGGGNKTPAEFIEEFMLNSGAYFTIIGGFYEFDEINEKVALSLIHDKSFPTNGINEKDFVPLIHAVTKKSLPIVEALLAKHDIQVNKPYDHGKTALVIAVQNNSLPIVKALLAKSDIDLNGTEKIDKEFIDNKIIELLEEKKKESEA